MPYFLQRAGSRRVGGSIIITDPEENSGMEQHRDTHQCPHCAAHFVVEPGSGKQRGWCFKCQATLCLQAGCNAECDPWEKKIERWEYEYRMEQNIRQIRG